jgi:hypothetical protein
MKGTPPKTKDLTTGNYQNKVNVLNPYDQNQVNYNPQRNRHTYSSHKQSIEEVLETPDDQKYSSGKKHNYEFAEVTRFNNNNNHPLDNFPQTNILRNNGKRINSNHNHYEEPRMSIQEQLRNHSINSDSENGRRGHRNGHIDERSVSRFNLDENRAHSSGETSCL